MTARATKLFLCGDVMTGRGVDQILPTPSEPSLREDCIRDARDYLALAEAASGDIQRPSTLDYVWGDALDELTRFAPSARIVNLETSITTSADYWPKGINYRMHPKNVGVLTSAAIDGCALANNHVLDFGYAGLAETIETLRAAGIAAVGAGRDAEEAEAPAVLRLDSGGRLLLFSLGSWSGGVPPSWRATPTGPGVFWFDESSLAAVHAIGARVRATRLPGDLAIASLHWGPNWGYAIPREQVEFARALVDEAGIDVVHGHSSHHPKGIEVRRGKVILYGCGDFLNDYEGISGHEAFRGDLALMYLIELHGETGALLDLTMVPMGIRKLKLTRAPAEDARWLAATLSRASEPFGTRILLRDDLSLDVGAGRP